ncbi:MAG: NnrU family protein, partial [Pseudomonadota bacterium]
MILLLAGLALWWGAHLFKRVAPGPRARLGEPGKGLAAVLILGSVVLIVLGYRQTAFIPVWSPPPWATHLNNLL